jgi:DNA polymerase I-like protein with 3'-5' exonuclease and polymerase domains
MTTEKSYVIVDSTEKTKELAKYILESDLIAFDTETNSLNTRKGQIIGFSVTTKEGTGYYYPTMIYSEGKLIENEIDGKPCHEVAKRLIEMLIGKKIIGHNLSFDTRFVKCFYGIDLTPSVHADTMLMVHTVREEGAGFGSSSPFALKEIAKSVQSEIGLDVEKEANEEQIELKMSIKANGGSTSSTNYEIYKADLSILGKYAVADTDLTLRIYNYFSQILEKEGLTKFFYEDEVMPLYKEVTIPMEECGVRLDMELITQAKQRVSDDLVRYHSIVTKELLEKPEVRTWVMYRAMEDYPPSNKGAYAQELVEELKLPFDKLASGKYSITANSVANLEDGPIKSFFETNDPTFLEEDTKIKIAVKMWKDQNNGNYFNIQSKDHLGEIAFGALGIQPLSTTKTGKPQFDDDLIQSIFKKHNWAKSLRIYNKLLKIKSTYVDRFLESEEGGNYYFYYKQHATVSGRYGSDAQQLPRPKEEGDDDPIVVEYNNMIRAFFVPKEGNIFIDCDYSSLEPRVFSHVSGDEGLYEIFFKDYDFYSTIAIKTEKLHQYSPDPKDSNFLKKVAPALRNKAKAYSLGIPYGMSPYALGMTIGVKRKEAEELVNGYLNGFPNLKKWMEESKLFAKENGYIKTQVGRIRHLDNLKKIYEVFGDSIMNYDFKKQLEKQYGQVKATRLISQYKNGVNSSMNFQIQSMAASVVNRAAIAINREFQKRGINGQVVAQVHDQLLMEVEESRAKEAAEIVQDKMENTTKLNVPLVAIPQIAKNMRDGH